VLDISGARENPVKKRKVEAVYVVASVIFYTLIYLSRR